MSVRKNLSCGKEKAADVQQRKQGETVSHVAIAVNLVKIYCIKSDEGKIQV